RAEILRRSSPSAGYGPKVVPTPVEQLPAQMREVDVTAQRARATETLAQPPRSPQTEAPVSETSSTRYRFGPLERRGLVAGWRGGQIGAVAVALVVGVGMLRASASPVGVVVALAALAIGVGVATWPIAGRTAEQGGRAALRHAVARAWLARGGPGE